MRDPVSLSIMVKAPTVGLAKTRMAPALGDAGAAKLARALLADALHSWRSAGCRITLATTGDFDPATKSLLAGWSQKSQGTGTLGERQELALRHGLEQGEIAALVGTDIPGVGPAQLAETLRLMQTYDAVLGPAEDGGYYWLALRSCPEGLLDGIPWSSGTTCERTKERLIAAGMRVAMLSPLFDVDRPADLGRMGTHLRSHPSALPHTRAFLASAANRLISVVIPVLNEEKRIGDLLRALRQDAPWAELIVVDGGSTDQSVAVASTIPGVLVLHAQAGRASQLNRGAAAAVGGTLLFLHADAQLPAKSLVQIQHVLDSGAHVAGAFRLRTEYDEEGRARTWVRPFLRLADLRSRYTKSPYGDQGLFVRASEFAAVGGFPDQKLFEDLHLSQALSRRAPLAILPGPIVVSGRRFQERPFYYLALMNSFPLLYRLGVAPGRLASLYPNHR